jgi:hypothetical protein
MFFGNKKKMMEKCQIFPFISEQEFVQQVSENTVSICPQKRKIKMEKADHASPLGHTAQPKQTSTKCG